MSDILRVVNSAGATILDLENIASMYRQRDSFKFTPPPAKRRQAASSRRFGGSQQTGESHDNATIGCTLIVKGATKAAASVSVQALLEAAEQAAAERFLEWRPDGMATSTFWKIKGTATWAPTYLVPRWSGANLITFDVAWPVAPLGRLLPTNTAAANAVTPITVAVNPIAGTAPAEADIELTRSTTLTVDRIWALLAWRRRRTAAPPAGQVAPFGVILPVSRSAMSIYAVDVGSNPETVRQLASAAGTTGTIDWLLAPGFIDPPDFSADGETDVEFYAHVEWISGNLVTAARATLSMTHNDLPSARTFSREHGGLGRDIVRPAASQKRVIRLGTLTMRTGEFAAGPIAVRLSTTLIGNAAAGLRILKLVAVPTHARAAGPTGKVRDTFYPTFMPAFAAAAVTKVIRSNLAGVLRRVIAGATSSVPDAGLGGEPIQLPAGNDGAEVFVWVQGGAVPDDPTAASADDAIDTSIAVNVVTTPRVRFLPNA